MVRRLSLILVGILVISMVPLFADNGPAHQAAQAPPVKLGTSGGNVNELGVNLGGGYRFALTGFSAYAEARYHHILNTSVNFIPITFGVTF